MVPASAPLLNLRKAVWLGVSSKAQTSKHRIQPIRLLVTKKMLFDEAVEQQRVSRLQVVRQPELWAAMTPAMNPQQKMMQDSIL